MKSPLHTRRNIPFFYNKTEKEMQQDPYERFDPMVIRQSMLHLADELWGAYPMQAIFDFTKPFLHQSTITSILEIGCGVGRWIADLAKVFPKAECWGLDYSYQMLKQADAVWKGTESIALNLSKYGFSPVYELKGQNLHNLHLGLAKATALPFENQSQDIVMSSFLLDRLADPIQGLREMKRVLSPEGTILLLTPLNFNQGKHWSQFTPPIKIYQLLIQMGFEVLEWKEDIIIEETLDIRGNLVRWKCIGFACR